MPNYTSGTPAKSSSVVETLAAEIARQIADPPPLIPALHEAAKRIVVAPYSAGVLRVLVTGHRRWIDLAQPMSVLHGLAEHYGQLVVIHGDGQGLDSLVHQYIEKVDGWTGSQHFAEWRRLGNYAGPARNKWMVLGAVPDICVGFPLRGSIGTKDCMTKAFLAGVPTYVCEWRKPSPASEKMVFRLRPFVRNDHWWHPQYGQDLLDLQKRRERHAAASESNDGP